LLGLNPRGETQGLPKRTTPTKFLANRFHVAVIIKNEDEVSKKPEFSVSEDGAGCG
jgi:hypothetical protein